MRYKDGTRELYDMKTDPGEFTNLADTEEFSPRSKQMETILQTRLDRIGIQAKNQTSKQRKSENQKQKPATSSK